MGITAVGSLYTASGTALKTLAVSPTTIGDVLVLGVTCTSATVNLSAVSGGGVASWSRLAQYDSINPGDAELWFGAVTTTGASTITITTTASGTISLIAGQFTLSTPAVWTVDTTATGGGGPVTSGWYPQVTPAAYSELYLGLLLTSGGGPGLATGQPGYVSQVWASHSLFAYLLSTTLATVGPQWRLGTTAYYYSEVSGLLIATQATPFAPTLGTPANGAALDLAGTPTFLYTYNCPGSPQATYAFRMKISGAGSYSYWNATTPGWQGTIVWNAGSTGSITFPSASFVDGNTYNWSVANGSMAGYNGPFATDFQVVAQAAPTVTVTAPTGTITIPNPTITWTETLGSGVQVTYQARTFSAAQYGAIGFSPGTSAASDDSGVVASAALTYTTASGLINGSYRSYVQITQTGGQGSAWAYHAFTVSVTEPAAPTLTATASTDGTTGCPVISLSVAGNNSGGWLGYDGAAILRSDGVYVRNASLTNLLPYNAVTDTATIEDFEVTPGVAYTYTATTYATITGYVYVSAASTGASASVSTAGFWLFDPLNTPGAITVPVMTLNAPVRYELSAAHYPIGNPTQTSYPTVVSSGYMSGDGTAKIQTFTAANYAGLAALLTVGRCVCISSPFGEFYYARLGPQPGGMASGTGNKALDVTLLPSAATSPVRTLNVSWVGIARPAV